MSYDVKGRKRVNGVKISILRSDVFFTCFPFVFQTVVCPHKMGGMEKVFVLPHNCTHIKITRPKVRINREFMQ